MSHCDGTLKCRPKVRQAQFTSLSASFSVTGQLHPVITFMIILNAGLIEFVLYIVVLLRQMSF
jgi:hypothetical protein